jgi:glutathione peroxidase-family protein
VPTPREPEPYLSYILHRASPPPPPPPAAQWNFSKFLVNKEGKVVGRYGSTTTPTQLDSDIAKLL